MQTFLPSTDFTQSAQWLDNQRLGKQRVEVLQILNALTNSDYGWQNHPAVKMWCGYEVPLIYYGLYICQEWKSRGYKDTCTEKIRAFLGIYDDTDIINPPWLTESFASNHRSILLGKVYEAYNLLQSSGYWVDDNKQMIKLHRKLDKAQEVLNWYKSLNWPESPAQRVEGKWPYEWPV